MTRLLIETAARIAAADLRERASRPEPEDVAEFSLKVARMIVEGACLKL